MVNELENIKEIENELLKVRLEIQEKEQEKKEKEKTANTAASVSGFVFGVALLSLMLLENRL